MLKRCEECGYTYSSRADICPRCGCPNIATIEKAYVDEQAELSTLNMYGRLRGVFIGLVLFFLYWKFMKPSFWPMGFLVLFICLTIGTIASIFRVTVIFSIIVWGAFVIFMSFISSALHIPEIVQEGIAVVIGLGSAFYLFGMPIIDFIKTKKYQNRKEELLRQDDSNLQYTYSEHRDDYVDVDYREQQIDDKDYN